MLANAHLQPLNAARAFEATLAPLSAHLPQTGGDGGIQLAHRDNTSTTLIASCVYEASSPANVQLYSTAWLRGP
jgi:hypothetical protein